MAHNNSTGGHAYAEVYLGQLDSPNSQVNDIINWLKHNFATGKIYTHVDIPTKDVWLNLDWGVDEKGNSYVGGGPFVTGDMNIVLYIRDNYKNFPLNLPEKTNQRV